MFRLEQWDWTLRQSGAAEVIERWGSSEAPSPNLQGVQNQQDAASCLTSFDAVATSAQATGTAIDALKNRAK